MPIDHDLLGMQRRDVPLGEIRIGTSVEVPGKRGRQPKRLNTFRFTTAVEFTARAVAKRFGGEVAVWDQRRGYFEVTTDKTSLNVWVPPRSLAVDANMELWADGKRLRQCTGRAMSYPAPESGQPSRPCMCPADPDERARMAAMRPPQACKPKTRITVSIPELPGLTGVWTLWTGSVSAAVETADSGDAMALARAGGAYLPAILYIHWRKRVSDASPYPVPVLMIGTSMEELARGELPAGPAGLVAQIQAGARPLAISAGAAEPAARQLSAPAARHQRPPTAQEIADAAADAATLADLTPLKTQANEHRLNEDMICPRGSEIFEELASYLHARREELSPAVAS
jgi:recombination directionality factor gp3-like protein